MSVIATNVEVDNDEDIYLNANQWSELRKVVAKADSENEDEDDDGEELKPIKEEDSEEEDDSEDA